MTRAGPTLAVLGLLTIVAAACAGGGTPAAATSPEGPRATMADDTPAATTPGPRTPGVGEFVNPVIRQNFPDPHVLATGGRYYAYATTDGVVNYQLARSDDLVEWEILSDPMPILPVWASGDTWAPEVAEIGGRFVMYFTARAFEVQRADGQASQCVGVAVADVPEGPFVDRSEAPLVCQPELGGTIDATVLVDVDGTRYLVYKNDGNCCAIETRFYGRRLADDGLTLEGEETDLGVANDNAWEGNVIEAPTIFRAGDRYVLLYSANNYAGADYAVGYAIADAPLGPYVDGPENPILVTSVPDAGVPALGPGHQAVVVDQDGDLWVAYHAWNLDLTAREMWIDPLEILDGRPVIRGPTGVPQPVP